MNVYGPENGAVSGLGERVDLDLCCVFFFEDPVQVDEDVGGLIRRPFRRKPKLLGDTDSRLFCQASCEWYGCGYDRLRDNPYRVAYTAISTSLFGDETRANHLTSQLLRFLSTVAPKG